MGNTPLFELALVKNVICQALKSSVYRKQLITSEIKINNKYRLTNIILIKKKHNYLLGTYIYITIFGPKSIYI